MIAQPQSAESAAMTAAAMQAAAAASGKFWNLKFEIFRFYLFLKILWEFRGPVVLGGFWDIEAVKGQIFGGMGVGVI